MILAAKLFYWMNEGEKVAFRQDGSKHDIGWQVVYEIREMLFSSILHDLVKNLEVGRHKERAALPVKHAEILTVSGNVVIWSNKVDFLDFITFDPVWSLKGVAYRIASFSPKVTSSGSMAFITTHSLSKSSRVTRNERHSPKDTWLCGLPINQILNLIASSG